MHLSSYSKSLPGRRLGSDDPLLRDELSQDELSEGGASWR